MTGATKCGCSIVSQSSAVHIGVSIGPDLGLKDQFVLDRYYYAQKHQHGHHHHHQ